MVHQCILTKCNFSKQG